MHLNLALKLTTAHSPVSLCQQHDPIAAMYPDDDIRPTYKPLVFQY